MISANVMLFIINNNTKIKIIDTPDKQIFIIIDRICHK
jgi:hypothetical protein